MTVELHRCLRDPRGLWLSLKRDANCVGKRDLPEETPHPEDIRKQLKPTLTAHYFRHNFVTNSISTAWTL